MIHRSKWHILGSQHLQVFPVRINMRAMLENARVFHAHWTCFRTRSSYWFKIHWLDFAGRNSQMFVCLPLQKKKKKMTKMQHLNFSFFFCPLIVNICSGFCGEKNWSDEWEILQKFNSANFLFNQSFSATEASHLAYDFWAWNFRR